MSLENMKRELRERFDQLNNKTWAEISQDVVEFYVKKYENYQKPGTHKMEEFVEEAENIVEEGKKCLLKVKGTRRWRRFEKELERFVQQPLRLCKTVRPESKILRRKKQHQCTFAVEGLRDLIHMNIDARIAFVKGCPVEGVSEDEAEDRVLVTLDDLDLASDLEDLKDIIARNRRYLRPHYPLE